MSIIVVDLVTQLREVKEKDFHPDTLRTMVLWGADEIERLKVELTAARDALYNDFEPDNQSRAWHRANKALRDQK